MYSGRTKPHTQIGQKGKGTGRPKPRNTPNYGTAGLPIQAGQFPKFPPQIPNFLPDTSAFEAGQGRANDALSAAGSQYGISTGLIGPQYDLAKARLDTDQRVATDRLKENLAERGVYTPFGANGMATNPGGGGIGETMYARQVATPFGRQYQDLAANASGQYADAANQYGAAQLGYNQQMGDLYNQRAEDAFNLMPLSVPTGGYQLPHRPGPMLTTNYSVKGGGKTRPKGDGGNKGGNKGGGRR